MSGTHEHAEDVDHELEHAGREVGQHFVEDVSEPDADESALIDSTDD